MKSTNILFLLSLGLLAWLFIDSFSHLDLAATKNNGLINSKKLELERIPDIDSVKNIAKANYDVIRNNKKTDSAQVYKRLWIITVLALLQIGILYLNRKSSKA